MAEPSGFQKWMTAALDWTVRYEGSTRSAALIRFFLPIVIWGRIGDRLLLYKVDHDAELFLATLLFFGATLAMMAGLFSRISVPLVGLMMTYFYLYRGLYEGEEAWRVIQQYWAPTLFMIFTSSGRSFSVDRWLAVRRAQKAGEDPPEERGNLMGLRLIAILVSSIYLWGSLDKMDVAFLSGQRLDRIWMHFYGSSDYPDWGWWPAAMWFFGTMTVVTEVSLALGLLYRPTRKYMVAVGIFMHAVFYMVLPVSSFSLMMWACYLAYFPADDIHRGLDAMMGHGPPAGGSTKPMAES